jgi:hypothetical protein
MDGHKLSMISHDFVFASDIHQSRSPSSALSHHLINKAPAHTLFEANPMLARVGARINTMNMAHGRQLGISIGCVWDEAPMKGCQGGGNTWHLTVNILQLVARSKREATVPSSMTTRGAFAQAMPKVISVIQSVGGDFPEQAVRESFALAVRQQAERKHDFG